MSKAAKVGIVNPGLTAESHALLQHCLIAFGNPGSFVALETNAVPRTMSEELLKPCLPDLVETLLVDLLGDRAFLHVFDTGVVGGQHGVEQPLGVIVRLTHP